MSPAPSLPAFLRINAVLLGSPPWSPHRDTAFSSELQQLSKIPLTTSTFRFVPCFQMDVQLPERGLPWASVQPSGTSALPCTKRISAKSRWLTDRSTLFGSHSLLPRKRRRRHTHTHTHTHTRQQQAPPPRDCAFTLPSRTVKIRVPREAVGT